MAECRKKFDPGGAPQAQKPPNVDIHMILTVAWLEDRRPGNTIHPLPDLT